LVRLLCTRHDRPRRRSADERDETRDASFNHLVGAGEQRKRESCQVESPFAGSGNEGVIPALRL
jgi:hypothetical protein